jgi:hypothetical protein
MMFIAEGQMRGNQGLFVIEDADLDSVDATTTLRNSYTCRRAESCHVKLAKKVIDPELEHKISEIIHDPRNAPGGPKSYNTVYSVEGGYYFIEFFPKFITPNQVQIIS